MSHEPKTPVKSKHNFQLAEDLRFFVSEEKPKRLDFVDQIFEDHHEDPLLPFSSSKEESSDKYN